MISVKPYIQNQRNIQPAHKSLQKVTDKFKKRDTISFNTENLLFLCSRKDLSESIIKEAVSLINKGIDWQKFLEYARAGAVTMLVYDALRKVSPYVSIPQFILYKLRDTYLYIISNNIRRHYELTNLLRQFCEKSIFVIPLKGTFLSKRLYEDIYWRDLSSDFDLLIHEEARLKARSLLQELGYMNISDSREEYLGNYVFVKPKALPIDLHWSITLKIGYSRRRTEALLRGIKSVEEDGVSYFEFRQEELLLYLCAHLASSSCFRQLRYVCDVDGLLSKYKETIDWDRLAAKAKLLRLSSSLYTALKLAKNFFRSEIEPNVFKKLTPGIPKLILINIFANKKVMLQKNSERRKLINKLLSPIFFRLIEGETSTVFFPPREALVTKNYPLRILKGVLIICSTFIRRAQGIRVFI